MNFIDVSFFSADTFDARRMSIASKPSRGTATSTNPYAARRWLGAANRKLASRSCIEIILESNLSAEFAAVSAEMRDSAYNQSVHSLSVPTSDPGVQFLPGRGIAFPNSLTGRSGKAIRPWQNGEKLLASVQSRAGAQIGLRDPPSQIPLCTEACLCCRCFLSIAQCGFRPLPLPHQ